MEVIAPDGTADSVFITANGDPIEPAGGNYSTTRDWPSYRDWQRVALGVVNRVPFPSMPA